MIDCTSVSFICNDFLHSITFGLQTSLPVELKLATVSLIPVCESFSEIMMVMIMSERSLSKPDDEVDLFTCTMYLTMPEKGSEENIFGIPL